MVIRTNMREKIVLKEKVTPKIEIIMKLIINNYSFSFMLDSFY
jgi:hypothetical protein